MLERSVQLASAVELPAQVLEEIVFSLVGFLVQLASAVALRVQVLEGLSLAELRVKLFWVVVLQVRDRLRFSLVEPRLLA